MANPGFVAMSRRATRMLPAALVAAVACLSVAAASTGAAGSRLDGPYPPHRAGMRISVAGTACTSGFGVIDTTTGSHHALTAGHCGARGRVKIGGVRVGSVAGSSFICCRLTSSDSSLYSVRGPQMSATVLRVRRTSPFDGAESIAPALGAPSVVIAVAGYLENSAIRTGMSVCAVGAFGGYACGKVTDTRYSHRFSGGRTLTGLACFDAAVSNGDSGGPVFVLRRGEAIAAGIVSIGDSAETCFSTIENALRAWSVDLLVADGTGFRPAAGGTDLADGFRNRPGAGGPPGAVPWDDALREFGFKPPAFG